MVALVAVAFLTGCGDDSHPVGSAITVRGMVLAAPGCPVERQDFPCPALRVAGAEVVASQGDRRVADSRSGADGSFSFALPAGTYTITASEPDGLRSSATQVVRVPQQGIVIVTITVDSGIR